MRVVARDCNDECRNSRQYHHRGADDGSPAREPPESHPKLPREPRARICAAKRIVLATANVLWDFRLPQLANAAELAKPQAGLKERSISVLIFSAVSMRADALARGNGGA